MVNHKKMVGATNVRTHATQIFIPIIYLLAVTTSYPL